MWNVRAPLPPPPTGLDFSNNLAAVFGYWALTEVAKLAALHMAHGFDWL